MLSGRVLITGGSGYLSRGILRRAQQENWPCEFIVYSRDEYRQDLCRAKYGTNNIKYVPGDIRDVERLTLVMMGCETVIHTAAMKYIPEAENNVSECISINVGGTQAVIAAARKAGVEQVVGISSDKAVLPVNTYGYTKSLLERLFIEASQYYGPSFHLVRYGNVVGSTGSVIPVFMRQKAETGTIKVTDPNMTRYWISIDHAINLILWALDNSYEDGSITIPKTCSMTMKDLALLIAHDECNIEVIGPRPGEKSHEYLIHEQESPRAADRGLYYELCSSGIHSEPFILSSENPQYRMTYEDMSAMIADSVLV